jgi:uncharacterized cupredoxin-like copper-binding protein
VPATLEPAPKINVPSKVSAVWNVGLGTNSNGSYWTLDGKPYASRRVVLKVSRGSTQMWLLRNPTTVTHYIHLHEEEWHTVLRDGKTPPPWERGLEDTWRLDPGESVQVAARFTDYDGVFMIHCHMLDHEDHGLMAQFAVVDPKTKALPAGYHYDPTGGPAALASRVTYSPQATQAVQRSLVAEILKAPASSVVDAADLMCGPGRNIRGSAARLPQVSLGRLLEAP